MNIPAVQAQDQEEDELRILSSLGSTTASASVYEQSVLRDARLKTAPQIKLPQSAIAATTIHNEKSVCLVPCGDEQPSFPDLSSLAYSTSSSRKKKGAHVDISHVMSILARTRALLQSALHTSNNTNHESECGISENEKHRRRKIDMLCMKEQILLSYLIDFLGVKDDGTVIPQRNVGSSQLQKNTSISDDYYRNASPHTVGSKNDDDRSRNSFTDFQAQTSSTNRLDRIKMGETLGIIEKRPLKRKTMMSLKSLMRIENGLTPLKTMDEERFDEEKCRKRRDDRKKRRLERQQASLSLGGSSDGDYEADLESMPRMISKNEKGLDGNESESNCDRDQIMIEKRPYCSKSSKSMPEVSLSTKDSTRAKVFCPVCQLSLSANREGDHGGSLDEFLAKHISECQKSSRASRNRSGKRLNREQPADFEFDEGEAVEPESDELNVINSDIKEENGISKHRHCPIDDIDEFDYEERVDNWIEHGLNRMKSLAEKDPLESPPGAVVYQGGLEIPAWMNNRLFSYQRAGVRWMWELHCQGVGGVVGDELGLGKTVQVSSFLGAMAINRVVDSVLIVAPATLLTHWLRELEIWAPGLRRVLIHRSGETDGVSRVISRGLLRSLKKWLKNARADRVNEAIDEIDYNQNEEHSFCGTGYAIVTSYESIRRSTDTWTNHNWSYVILDEGQKIRNPDADITLACKRLRTPHRLLLSGTPIQNDLRELWSLFDFIIPGRLGTLPAFEAEFSEPIRRGGYLNATPMQLQVAYRCALVLRDLINPYLLRRQKKDVAEVSRMPSKTEQVLFCRLSPKQRLLYEEYLKSDEVTGVMRGSVQLLKAVTVLRKICNHTDLIVGRNDDSSLDDDSESSYDDEICNDDVVLADKSGKLQVLSKILPLWKKQGHKVIIFTQWRKMLNIIEQFVIHKEWTYARLDGNTNIASRQRLVDRFNNDASYFCMLMTTRTGGVGLNITGANRVLLYDPDWNPSTDEQARGRAWRFGQTREVTIYRLITAGTIEEKIYQRQIFKTALTNQILQDPKQRRFFSQKELRDLFTLKADSDNITETGKVAKGGVVFGEININVLTHDENEVDQKCDNKNSIKDVLKSKGICGIFDHNFIEKSSTGKKPLSEVEMEENAKKLAMKAASALHASSLNQKLFEPTWTGSEDTRPLEQNDNLIPMSSSDSLLANLQNRRIQIALNQSTSQRSGKDAETEKNSKLLLRMKNYIKRTSSANGYGPTTRELLEEFKDVPNSDAPVFRSMLRSIAEVRNGKWKILG